MKKQQGADAEPIKTENYFCTGFLLLNLKSLRNIHFTEKAIEFLLRHPNIEAPDQEAFNYVLKGHTGLLSRNRGEFTAFADIPLKDNCCLHYAGDTPWVRKRFYSAFDFLWWDFVKTFDFHEELAMQGFVQKSGCVNRLTTSILYLPVSSRILKKLIKTKTKRVFRGIRFREKRIIYRHWKAAKKNSAENRH